MSIIFLLKMLLNVVREPICFSSKRSFFLKKKSEPSTDLRKNTQGIN